MFKAMEASHPPPPPPPPPPSFIVLKTEDQQTELTSRLAFVPQH